MEQVKHILSNNSSQSLTKYYLSLIDKVLLIVYMMNYKNKVFQNYNELTNYEIQNAERLIIQLDSLVRLNDKDDITQKKYVPNYDLIVVDEMEGILSHFNGRYLKK